MNESRTVFLGLGSNLGRRLANLRDAVRELADTEGVSIPMVSPIYESEAHTKHYDDALGDFLNLVLQIETVLSPFELLDVCLAVEAAKGRQRMNGSWLPRTIDIDILAFADQAVNSERLKVPHPRMAERRFVLLPFADLAPGFRVPEPFDATVKDLLIECPDTLSIARRYPGNAVITTGGGSK